MYGILEFRRGRGNWQERGTRVAAFPSSGAAYADVDARRDAARAADNQNVYYRVICEPSAAMLGYRDALTQVERTLYALQSVDVTDLDADAKRRAIAEQLTRHCAEVERFANLRLAEVIE